MKELIKNNQLRYVFNFLLICMVLMSVSSCKKFLEEKPQSNSSDANYWLTEAQGNSAIAGGYSLLRKALNDGLFHYAHGDLPTDEFSSERAIGGEDWQFVQNMEWYTAVPSASTYRPLMKLRRFDNFYSAINWANRCIAGIPTIPVSGYKSDAEAKKRQFLGEAYFIRAFSYFYMGRVFGGVPIINDQSSSEEVDLNSYRRSTEAEVFAKATSDAKIAQSYLTWDYSTSADRAVRANKGAVLALLAHIYAWQGNYAACETVADSVVNSGTYGYVDRANYLAVFKGQSTEGIFEIAQNSANEATGLGGIGTFLLKSPYLTTNTGTTVWPLDTVTVKQNLFTDQDDLRRKNGFGLFNTADPVCIKYSNITYTSSISPLTMNNIIVFRLSDIALLEAEAQAAQGKNPQARILLNNIRTLAGLGVSTASDSDLFSAIIEERGRELFMEGHRFYDLVRLARVKGIYKFGNSSSNKINATEFQAGKYFWPIDPVLVQANALFTQTPFWAARML